MPSPISPVTATTVRTAAEDDNDHFPNWTDPDVWFASASDHYRSNALKWGMWGNVPMSSAYSALAEGVERTWKAWQVMGWCDGEI